MYIGNMMLTVRHVRLAPLLVPALSILAHSLPKFPQVLPGAVNACLFTAHTTQEAILKKIRHTGHPRRITKFGWENLGDMAQRGKVE